MHVAIRNTDKAWGLVSQFFHWLIVALIIFQYTWAWRIDHAEGLRERLALVPQHKTVGIIILVLAALRLAWRFFNRTPAMPKAMPAWERFAAHAGHWLLYGLLFAVPLSGWAYSSAAGLGDYWWGPVSLPDLVASSEALENTFKRVHDVLTTALAVVAIGHAAAALRHHFWIKDDILKRMLPIWKKD